MAAAAAYCDQCEDSLFEVGGQTQNHLVKESLFENKEDWLIFKVIKPKTKKAQVPCRLNSEISFEKWGQRSCREKTHFLNRFFPAKAVKFQIRSETFSLWAL